MPTTWSAATPITDTDAWERTLRALATGMLRWAAEHARRRQQRERRQRVRQARRARHAQRLKAHALRRDVARQISPALRRDLGL